MPKTKNVQDEITIKYLPDGREITHPSGRVVIESNADLDWRVQQMEYERERLRLRILHTKSEKAKCLASMED